MQPRVRQSARGGVGDGEGVIAEMVIGKVWGVSGWEGTASDNNRVLMNSLPAVSVSQLLLYMPQSVSALLPTASHAPVDCRVTVAPGLHTSRFTPACGQRFRRRRGGQR